MPHAHHARHEPAGDRIAASHQTRFSMPFRGSYRNTERDCPKPLQPHLKAALKSKAGNVLNHDCILTHVLDTMATDLAHAYATVIECLPTSCKRKCNTKVLLHDGRAAKCARSDGGALCRMKTPNNLLASAVRFGVTSFLDVQRTASVGGVSCSGLQAFCVCSCSLLIP